MYIRFPLYISCDKVDLKTWPAITESISSTMPRVPLPAVMLTAAAATVNQLTPGKDITTSPKEAINQSTTRETRRQRSASKVDGQQAGTAEVAPKRVCLRVLMSSRMGP